MIELPPNIWYALFALMTAVGAGCILLGFAAGMTAAERYAEAERTVGEKLRLLVRLPKLRLVQDVHLSHEEVLRLQRAAGELTGLNKTLESEFVAASDLAAREAFARGEAEERLAVAADERDAAEHQLVLVTTAVGTLCESWDRLGPTGNFSYAAREVRDLLKQIGVTAELDNAPAAAVTEGT